ncbi:helix-turn-helix domain-containing protein [Clostridium perfringens]|nr:helix-turn-helix transcriptional regulator [Clostridium perfringens]MDU4222155.1 helix-turn-helix transcriptional regulator [Clostridium perfringens]MDZ5007264.1 helix-turn-helix domain-containing protein [Clostridium perfringens]HAT4114579.1 helix-turn-helix transcriptional regulator [Clostridium perfringens]
MNLGENIKSNRLKKKLTQKKLAETIGVSTITIQNYENNRREPNIETLNKIANSLDIPVSELLGETVSMFSGIGGAYQLFKKISTLPLIGEEYLKSFDEKTLNYFEKEFEEKKFYYNLKSILNELEFDIDSLSEKEQKEIYKKILEYVQFEIFKLTNSKEK